MSPSVPKGDDSSPPKMSSIMAKSPHDSSFSFSRRQFHRIVGKVTRAEAGESEREDETLTFTTSIPSSVASRMRSALTAAFTRKTRRGSLGARVTGTIFGHRRGHVNFAFQANPRSLPAVLLELATPTSTLVREMASGLVRIALECDREGKWKRLVDEPMWRAYCNGKKCGYAVRRDCGPSDWSVLRTVEPVSMGAGVLPGAAAAAGGSPDGEMMYMRARFERVVGSRDSEAFYMMNPDGNGGPELSIYLLRV